VLGLFAIANAYSFGRLARIPRPLLEDHSAGFPFPVYAAGPDQPGTLYVYGILLDLVSALTVAMMMVWVVRAFRVND